MLQPTFKVFTFPVLHPEEIWGHWFQLGVLAGREGGGLKAELWWENIRL